jgi:hypothetical protein
VEQDLSELLSMGSLSKEKMSFHQFESATPNPSIERTCPGKPGHASHLKR